MKFLLPFLLMILLLSACYPATPTTPPEGTATANPLTARLNTMDSRLTEAEAGLSKLRKSYSEDIDTLNNKIRNIQVPSSTGGGVSQASFDSLKSDYTTTVQNLNNKIADLQKQVDALKSSGTGSGTGTGGTGTTTTGGGINVTFNPQPQPTWGSTSTQTFYYYMNLSNTGSVGKYVKLQALFTSMNGQPVNVATNVTALEVSYPTTVQMTLVYSPADSVPDNVATGATTITGVWNGTPFFIPGNGSATVVAKFTLLHTAGSTQWTPTFTPIASDQPY
jgi:hypothetical protein